MTQSVGCSTSTTPYRIVHHQQQEQRWRPQRDRPQAGKRHEYIRHNYGSISLAEAIRELVPDAVVTVVPGCGVLDSEPHDIPAAVTAAENADVVVAAFGGRGGWIFGPTEGEGTDSADIDLPHNQRELLAAVAATGKKVIGVLSTGRPMALTETLPSLAAPVHAYYGGQRGTRGVAAALFSITNPGGKLRYSMPRHAGQFRSTRVSTAAAATVAP